MRRPLSKLPRQVVEIDSVPLLELGFTDPMLLLMVVTAQADRPPVGRFHRQPAIGPCPHMRASIGTCRQPGTQQ